MLYADNTEVLVISDEDNVKKLFTNIHGYIETNYLT